MTVALLEGTVVEEAFDFDPITLQSGRVSELSSEFQPDVTRVTCKTFEGLVRKVEDDEFAEFLIELRQDQDRQAIMDQVRRSMYRALPAPEPIEPETVNFVPRFEPADFQEADTVRVGPISAAAWTDPDDELLQEFTDSFPRVDVTATDIPVIVERKTGARYKDAFWGKAAGRDFAKPKRRSLRHLLRDGWEYLIHVRRSGQ